MRTPKLAVLLSISSVFTAGFAFAEGGEKCFAPVPGKPSLAISYKSIDLEPSQVWRDEWNVKRYTKSTDPQMYFAYAVGKEKDEKLRVIRHEGGALKTYETKLGFWPAAVGYLKDKVAVLSWDGELALYKPGDAEPVRMQAVPRGPAGEPTLRAHAFLSNGKIAYHGWDDGVTIFDPVTKERRHFPLPPRAPRDEHRRKYGTQVFGFTELSDEKIAVTGEDKLYVLDTGKNPTVGMPGYLDGPYAVANANWDTVPLADGKAVILTLSDFGTRDPNGQKIFLFDSKAKKLSLALNTKPEVFFHGVQVLPDGTIALISRAGLYLAKLDPNDPAKSEYKKVLEGDYRGRHDIQLFGDGTLGVVRMKTLPLGVKAARPPESVTITGKTAQEQAASLAGALEAIERRNTPEAECFLHVLKTDGLSLVGQRERRVLCGFVTGDTRNIFFIDPQSAIVYPYQAQFKSTSVNQEVPCASRARGD